MNPPKPSAIRILEGNRGRRPYNTDEPQPHQGEPGMPAHLDPIARREWRRLVPILRSMRVLTVADGPALANICQAHSVMVRAMREMRKLERGGKSSLLMQTPSGYVQQSPLLGIVNAQIQLQTHLLREFGMTPSSRTRIQTQEAERVDPVEAAMCA